MADAIQECGVAAPLQADVAPARSNTGKWSFIEKKFLIVH